MLLLPGALPTGGYSNQGKVNKKDIRTERMTILWQKTLKHHGCETVVFSLERKKYLCRLIVYTMKEEIYMKISLIIIIIASILVTFILNQIFKKKRYIKYIPVIIMLPFMLYYFITMNSASSESFESLGKFVMGLFLLIACFSSIIFSVTADIFHKRRKLK